MNTIVACLRPAAAVAATALSLAAQTCWHQGSTPIAATITASPVALACPGALGWPSWQLFTPAHRAPVAHTGYWPGPARALPGVFVSYTCSGFLLAPIDRTSISTLGYVLDRAEHACPATH